MTRLCLLKVSYIMNVHHQQLWCYDGAHLFAAIVFLNTYDLLQSCIKTTPSSWLKLKRSKEAANSLFNRNVHRARSKKLAKKVDNYHLQVEFFRVCQASLHKESLIFFKVTLQRHPSGLDHKRQCNLRKKYTLTVKLIM